ncbi:MAG: DUF2279 domain-containing protein [Bacteroidetes bacterium]|nr:DUF2279 domain-containing protein [Bacteroidota bacterium]
MFKAIHQQFSCNLIFLIVLVQPYCELKAQESEKTSDSLTVKNSLLPKSIALSATYYAGAMWGLQKTWYKDREKVPFHFKNDNKAYLQVDKFGHAFGAYIESYIGYHWMLKSGYSKKEALMYGASLGLILQTPIEIMDATHEGIGFSWGDMAANALGSGLVIGQELVFNQQLITYKFSYWETSYAQQAHGYLGTTTLDRMLKDYNGHTYWLSMPVNKIINNEKIPIWLNIAAGYGANGMYGEYENIATYKGVDIPITERYRQYLVSLDIDWTKIKTASPFVKTLLKGLTFVKLPFPALEINSKGKLKGYWIYF